MGDFHIIGENRVIAQVNGADEVRTVVVNDVIYAYWRSSTELGKPSPADIWMSKSSDRINWSTPIVVFTGVAGYDYRLGGVVHDGTNFIMAIGEMGVPGGATTNFFFGSATGDSFAGAVPIPLLDYWSCVSDMVKVDSTWYLAVTIRTAINSPYVVKLYSSVNWDSWVSLGLVSQLTSTDNVHPRITLDGSTVHVVMREGPYFSFSGSDRILYTSYDVSTRAWSPTVPVTNGTGDPGIVSVPDGLAIIYQDQSLYKDRGQWSWMLYDGDTFVRRGTFSQGLDGGAGAAVFAYGDDFAVTYATRPDNTSTAGTLYFRDFNSVVDEPEGIFAPLHEPRVERQPEHLDNFEVVISAGNAWYSLTDGSRFYMSAEDFGDKAQVLRRITATSPFFDGTYLIHSTRENVQEMLTIGILGGSQNQVTENMLLLEELVSQPSFRIRLTMGDHQETWLCQSADYTIQRGHINMHNTRAMMRISVPRLPQVSYEVV
jgi:hypothetical protein